MKKNYYKINIIVRDANNKVIKDEVGNKRTNLDFDTTINEGNEETYLIQLNKTLKTWMNQNEIQLELNAPDSISGGYITMYSLYDNKVTKHH